MIKKFSQMAIDNLMVAHENYLENKLQHDIKQYNMLPAEIKLQEKANAEELAQYHNELIKRFDH